MYDYLNEPDSVLPAEGLNQGEVNVQGDIALLALRQNAQHHFFWTTANNRDREDVKYLHNFLK